MKKIITIMLFLLFQSVFAQESQSFDFNKIYSFVLQGDVAKVIKVLDTLPDDRLSDSEKKIKAKFFKRFKHQEEEMEYNTGDILLHDVLKIYRSYWKGVLLDKENAEIYEERLKKDIACFLKENDYPARTVYERNALTQKDIEDNFTQHLKDFLSERNYYSATGRTAGIFDLFIWSTQVPTEYVVALPETEVTTTIIFLEDVVTMGWEEYASFGKVYPGGWATKEVLYAVAKAYDTSTENFRVSYLKHESQHFADYKVFPNLSGADLEYRAKLVELIYAEETFYDLISLFIRNASSEGRNPHAFGAYALIRDLSEEIFGKDFVAEIEQWQSVPAETIKKESENLLKAHTHSLHKAGADSVTEFIEK